MEKNEVIKKLDIAKEAVLTAMDNVENLEPQLSKDVYYELTEIWATLQVTSHYLKYGEI